MCLGAIAAQAALGSSFKVDTRRGQVIDAADYRVMATTHPLSVLCASDRATVYEAFVADLRTVRAHLGKSAGAR